MSRVFLIPLQSGNQTLTCPINGTNYGFKVVWNSALQSWVMDIYDGFSNPILCGTPLITGADLLAQYTYLNIGNGVQLIVITTAIGVSPDEVPNRTNLGTDGNLYYVTPPFDPVPAP